MAYKMCTERFKQMRCITSGVPIIDYNRSLIENLERRDNRLWKIFNRLSHFLLIIAKKSILTNKNIKTCVLSF